MNKTALYLGIGGLVVALIIIYVVVKNQKPATVQDAITTTTTTGSTKGILGDLTSVLDGSHISILA